MLAGDNGEIIPSDCNNEVSRYINDIASLDLLNAEQYMTRSNISKQKVPDLADGLSHRALVFLSHRLLLLSLRGRYESGSCPMQLSNSKFADAIFALVCGDRCGCSLENKKLERILHTALGA